MSGQMKLRVQQKIISTNAECLLEELRIPKICGIERVVKRPGKTFIAL